MVYTIYRFWNGTTQVSPNVILKMNIKQKASLLSAFITGIIVFVPVLIFKKYTTLGMAGTFILSFTCLAYLVALFLFVHDPAHWDKYAFFPNDGIFQTLERALIWLCGCVISVSILESTNAI